MLTIGDSDNVRNDCIRFGSLPLCPIKRNGLVRDLLNLMTWIHSSTSCKSFRSFASIFNDHHSRSGISYYYLNLVKSFS